MVHSPVKLTKLTYNPRETSELTGIPLATLTTRRYRTTPDDPRYLEFIKDGGAIRYTARGIMNWFERNLKKGA